MTVPHAAAAVKSEPEPLDVLGQQQREVKRLRDKRDAMVREIEVKDAEIKRLREENEAKKAELEELRAFKQCRKSVECGGVVKERNLLLASTK